MRKLILILVLLAFAVPAAAQKCAGEKKPAPEGVKGPEEHKKQHCVSTDQVERLHWLYKTAPRPAGMGGAFTAVEGDPIGMWWNPAAAMHGQRLAISGTHSLRHFPGPRGNLDQFDADLMGVTIPLASRHMLGIAMTVPGEWGVDYTDTNDTLHACKCKGHEAGTGPTPRPPRCRGRERRVALGNIHTAHDRRGLSAVDLGANWYRTHGQGDRIWREFQHGAGFSFFYETSNGVRMGATVRTKRRRMPEQDNQIKMFYDVTLGLAYKADPQADTLAAVDFEWLIDENLDSSQWRYYLGVERKYRDKAFARTGVMHNNFTYGLGARSAHLRLDYAVVRDILPDVAAEDPGRFRDGHFLSYTLTE